MIYLTQGFPSQGMSLTLCPPLDVNDGPRSVTAPGLSGPAVGTTQSVCMSGKPAFARSDSFARAAVRSQVSIKPDSLMPSRIAALSMAYDTQTVIKKTIANMANSKTACRCMSASSCRCNPAKFISPPKKSNRDVNGRVVTKGLCVSRMAIHYRVVSVRLGRARVVPVDAFGRSGLVVHFFPCEVLQVVLA